MKNAITVASACLALVGCHKSLERQFTEMCRDPAVAADAAGTCENRANLSEQDKQQVVDAYHAVKKAQAKFVADHAQ